MKILIHSNAAWAGTGYGNQVDTFFTGRLQSIGHEVIISAFYGLSGAVLNLGDVKVLPSSKDQYGNDLLLSHTQYYDPALVITLVDHWVMNPDMIKAVGKLYGWAPVDHNPIPPAVVQAARVSRGMISFSKFGEQQMQNAGLKPYYVPHGVDTEKYKPVLRSEARKFLGIPEDVFIAGIVSANKGTPSRKAFDQQIRAFTAFQKRHTNSILYIHSDKQGIYGEDLDRIIELAGLPRANVRFVNQYEYLNGMLGAAHMAKTYSAFDVLLNATRGEGFGIPIIEAQSCGVPVITTNFTAMPELTKTGWTVEYSDLFYTTQGSYQCTPSVADIEAKLELAFALKGDEDFRRKARADIMEYDADAVTANYWKPVLEQIADELQVDQKEREVITIPARKVEKPAPKVSILMPAYNAIETIDKAIESVIAQDVNYELIIVDDHSDDGTWKHLRKWRDNPCITIIKNDKPGGPVGALNTATTHARGEYIIKLDSDDWYEPGCLKTMADALDSHPDTGFVYGVTRYHGKRVDVVVPRAINPEKLLNYNPVIGEMMYRAEAHQQGVKHRGFYERDGRWFGPHDWDLVLQLVIDLSWKGMPLVDTTVLHYNYQDGSASNETARRGSAVIEALRQQWATVQKQAG